MANITDPVDEILEACGMSAPWEQLEATGLANRIYATKDVVIRIAKEHDEALRDARTESIAAPVAYAAGILTPRLLVFDESGTLFHRPYSIWERVHGETLGLLMTDTLTMPNTWRQVGHQLARLHLNVKHFEDPKNYLHQPRRNLNLPPLLESLVFTAKIQNHLAQEIVAFIEELLPAVRDETDFCFLHSDVKEMNIMCTVDDQLLALIDWGDAGWGDPTFDFRQIPLEVMPIVLEGYKAMAPNLLGDTFKERIIWDKLNAALENALANPQYRIPVYEFRQFLNMNHLP